MAPRVRASSGGQDRPKEDSPGRGNEALGLAAGRKAETGAERDARRGKGEATEYGIPGTR